MSATSPWAGIRFAIDRGGTFTDLYAELPDGRHWVLKLLSEDPANYADAPREGIRRVLEQVAGVPLPPEQLTAQGIAAIRMGTTVATNALLERKGAPTLLLMTKGAGDLLQIGDQTRPELFALDIRRPEQLYQQVVEVDERIRPAQPTESEAIVGHDGRRYVVEAAPDEEAVREALRQAYRQGCRSVAIALCHAYACPQHELRVAELARQLDFDQISLSHQVMPTVRLVPRGDTTVVDAYLTPHIQHYIASFRAGFQDQLRDTELLFMASDGGLVEATRFNGSRALLSGPAGGVVGYAQTCRQAVPGKPVIGFDMGGTSTDVSRYDGHYDLVQHSEVAGVRIQAPQLDIRTVAAGGGSRLFFRHGMFEVGPESAGSHPGPVCYRKGGHLTVTDANLILGRLQPEFFPHIFGEHEDQPLDVAATRRAFSDLTAEVNRWLVEQGRPAMSLEQVAAGFIDVANEQMARPIRAVSVQRGYDLAEHVLACFGGAGGQHACAMAAKLGIGTIHVHRYAGILSAYGMGLAEQVVDRQEAVCGELTAAYLVELEERQRLLACQAQSELLAQGGAAERMVCQNYLNLRYAGTDHALMIARPEDGDYRRAFEQRYCREYGFTLQAAIVVDDVRVRLSTSSVAVASPLAEADGAALLPPTAVRCYFADRWHDTPVYQWTELNSLGGIAGPALIIQSTATLVVEPQCHARMTPTGDVLIEVTAETATQGCELDPVQLALYSNRFMSIAEQMGYTLQRTAISTNIKERCDFSCALFDAQGALIANAPHTPVHLGAMGQAVRCQIERFADQLAPGDVLLSNHPQMGGSHLPDMTVISPVWLDGRIVLYVANRGHHADIGGLTPGSMPPFSTSLVQEGCAIRGIKLVEQGAFQTQRVEQLLRGCQRDDSGRSIAGSRRLADNLSDLQAQVAANQCGARLVSELIATAGLASVQAYMGYIQDHAERAVRNGLLQLRHQRADNGVLEAEDRLDDGTLLHLKLTIDERGQACFDFSASGPQHWGNLNTPQAVTWSAILYALRCLVNEPIPLNQGCLRPVVLRLAPGSILAPHEQAAVVGGNVLTSQRLVDVIFKAFGCVAASQGCMNNLTFGDERFGYYETIGGGCGAGPGWHGCSGVHSHMTNTRITDVEILESRYPVVVRRFSLRRGSGGDGQYRGGDGLMRELEFLAPLQVAILSERRVFAPYGLEGGESGKCGKNSLLRADGTRINLGGKNTVLVQPGDRLRIETPGGGGYGKCAPTEKALL